MKKIVFLMMSVIPLMLFAQKSITTEPDVDISVNKEYDENGNIIRYDSTYSYSYSGGSYAEFDSIMKSMMPGQLHGFNDPFFSDDFMSGFPSPFGGDPFFNNFFLTDSLMQEMMNSFWNQRVPNTRTPPSHADELLENFY